MAKYISCLLFLHLGPHFCNVRGNSTLSRVHSYAYTVSRSKLNSSRNDLGAAAAILWPIRDHDYLPRHFWQRLFDVGLQALALLALAVAILSPFFDHFYAQRDPHHAHIFLGAVDAAALADHHHPSPAERSNKSDETELLNATGVFSVPAAGDWAPQGLRAPLLLMLALPLAFFAAAMGRFERLGPRSVISCSQPFLPPPDKPPRF